MISVQKLHSAAVTRKSRMFYSLDKQSQTITERELEMLYAEFGVIDGDVIIFPNGALLVCGTRIWNSIFANKNLLIVIRFDEKLYKENDVWNQVIHSCKETQAVLTVKTLNAEYEQINDNPYATERVIIQYDDIFLHLSGRIDYLFRHYWSLREKYKVKWHLFSKNLCVFDNALTIRRQFKEEESESELEKRKIRHYILVDICFALSPLELPNYVILEIIDWIDYLYYDGHKEKISLIEGIEKSIRKIKGSKLDE